MKYLKRLSAVALAAALCVSLTAVAGEKNQGKKPKPYPLDTCLVSGEKLEGDKVFRFVHEGQEVKLCCKSCQKDFKKEPDKYMKKLAEAPKK